MEERVRVFLGRLRVLEERVRVFLWRLRVLEERVRVLLGTLCAKLGRADRGGGDEPRWNLGRSVRRSREDAPQIARGARKSAQSPRGSAHETRSRRRKWQPLPEVVCRSKKLGSSLPSRPHRSRPGVPMNPTIDILRAELERLFSLDEMTSMSQSLLGLDPEEVGGAMAKASFARALTERCLDGDQLDALVDVILISRQGVDPRVATSPRSSGGKRFPTAASSAPSPSSASSARAGSRSSTPPSRRDERRALKVLRREACRDKRAVQRFLTANRLVAAIEHPGLPTGLDAGEYEGTYWISYDHIDAQPLSARIARTGASHLRDAKPLLRGILEPLAALHRARIVHGDLKLENVLVGYGDGGPRVTLIDFGTDRLRQRATVSNGHTGVLAVFGSPKTIAPEQVRGHRADAATRRLRVRRDDVRAAHRQARLHVRHGDRRGVRAHRGAPEPPSTKAPRGWITPEIDEFVLSLLSKDPARRPKDAFAVLDELESLGRAVGRDAGVPQRLPRGEADGARRSAHRRARRRRRGPRARKGDRGGRRPGGRRRGVRGRRPRRLRGGRGMARGQEGAALPRGPHLRQRAERQGRRGASVRGARRARPEGRDLRDALDEVRKALGKYEEIVELLISQSESAAPGRGARAHLRRDRTALRDGARGPRSGHRRVRARALRGRQSDAGVAERDRASRRRQAAALERGPHHADRGHQGGASRRPSRRTGSSRTRLAGTRAKSAGPTWRSTRTSRSSPTIRPTRTPTRAWSSIYRQAQQWPELVATLARAPTRPATRPARATSAPRRPRSSRRTSTIRPAPATSTRSVLAEDPAHSKASDAMARIAERTGDFQTARRIILERRAETRAGPRAGRGAAQGRRALRGPPQRSGRGHAPLRGGARDRARRPRRAQGPRPHLQPHGQVQGAPRQPRAAGRGRGDAAPEDQPLRAHGGAARRGVPRPRARGRGLEPILAIDAAHEGALTTLARHYRALEPLGGRRRRSTRSTRTVDGATRRAGSSSSCARARAAPSRSARRSARRRSTSRCSSDQPGHAGALEALARLREQAGDAHAALIAIEALAAKAPTPEAQGRAVDPRRAAARGPRRSRRRDRALQARARRQPARRGDRHRAPPGLRRARRRHERRRAHRARARRSPRATSPRRASTASSRASSATSSTTDDKAERPRGRRSSSTRRTPTRCSSSATSRSRASATSRRPGTSSRSSAARRRSRRRTPCACSSASSRLRPERGRAAPSSTAERRDARASAVRSAIRTRAWSRPLQSLEEIAPDDADALARVARVMFESNDARVGADDVRAPARAPRRTTSRERTAPTRSAASASRSGASASSTRRSTRSATPPTRTRQPRPAPRARASLRADGRLGGGRPHEAPPPRGRGRATSASSCSSRSATSSSRSSTTARAPARPTSPRSTSAPTTASSSRS